jgi:alginate O-acetyltransferase complex protein AlgI
MILNSNVFLLVFLPIVFVLFWSARTKRQRYILMTVSGYIFYGYWNWRFCFLLLLSSLISYVTALRLIRSSTYRARRGWVMLSIAADLLILGFFKY